MLIKGKDSAESFQDLWCKDKGKKNQNSIDQYFSFCANQQKNYKK